MNLGADFLIYQASQLWYLTRITARAFLDLMFTFFPLLLLMFCFYLRDGNTEKVIFSSDLALLVATLFAEGIWRSINRKYSIYLIPLGFLGAVLSAVLAVCSILMADRFLNNPHYLNALAINYLFAIMYALLVRLLALLDDTSIDKPQRPADANQYNRQAENKLHKK